MAAKPLPSQELLLKLLRYEPDTGKLYWKKRRPSTFKASRDDRRYSKKRMCAMWNKAHAGKEAINCRMRGTRYYTGSLFDKRCLAHRIIWKMVHNEEPPEIDHINGDRADNRLCNLRAADKKMNTKNKCLSSRNTSGVNGVYWDSKRKRWMANIKANYKTTYLGMHKNKESAIAARKSAESKLGFHPNHGRKPNAG